MLNIEQIPLPSNALLNIYNINGCHTDCYTTEIKHKISFEQFVKAFYSTPLFRVERFILKWAVAKPSSDNQINELLDCKSTQFAAWTVEKRTENQLLMCDFQKRTRSWFKVASQNNNKVSTTHLYFGSAVVPKLSQDPNLSKAGLGLFFSALLGFHKLYSILLLFSAKKKLLSSLKSNSEI